MSFSKWPILSHYNHYDRCIKWFAICVDVYWRGEASRNCGLLFASSVECKSCFHNRRITIRELESRDSVQFRTEYFMRTSFILKIGTSVIECWMSVGVSLIMSDDKNVSGTSFGLKMFHPNVDKWLGLVKRFPWSSREKEHERNPLI